MHKLAIVVGHNSKSPGAVRSDTGESEFAFNSRLAAMMQEKADEYGIDLRIFKRISGGGYAEVDNWRADASIELHFNSAGDPSASGTETFSSGSSKSLLLAQEVQMEMVDTLGLKNRGVQVRNSRTKGRGYLSLVTGRCPAILVEPFFGSSSKGKAATDEKFEQEKLAECILEGAKRALDQF